MVDVSWFSIQVAWFVFIQNPTMGIGAPVTQSHGPNHTHSLTAVEKKTPVHKKEQLSCLTSAALQYVRTYLSYFLRPANMVRELSWTHDMSVLNGSSRLTLMTRETLSIQPFRRSHSCEPLYDDSIDVVAFTSFAPFARVISCPFVSKRDEYNRDIGRTTELELEEHFEPPIKQPRVS